MLGGQWAAVAVVTREDVLALRLTLLCAHVRPDIPLWVTVFDRTLIHRLRQDVPSVKVISSAELVAREIADYCCTTLANLPGRKAALLIPSLPLLVSPLWIVLWLENSNINLMAIPLLWSVWQISKEATRTGSVSGTTPSGVTAKHSAAG